MTITAHRTNRPTARALAETIPMSPARRRAPSVPDASKRLIKRLSSGPATAEQLMFAIYEEVTDKRIKTLHALIGVLRNKGYVIQSEARVYCLVSQPSDEPPSQKTRTVHHAIYAALTTRGRSLPCDCGRPATNVALFYQLTAECRYRYLNALVVCPTCAADFIDAEKILTMEEAYELANIPLPQTSQP